MTPPHPLTSSPPPPVSRLSEVEILLAPLAALVLLFSTRVPVLTSVGLIVLVGVWLVRWRVQGKPFHPTPLNLALLLFLTVIPLAVWASAVPDLTTEALAYLLAGVVLFSAVIHWTRTPGRAWWVWGGLVTVGLALTVLAPLAMIIPLSKVFALPSLYTRWAGRFPETINANVMAGAMVILWPVALSGIQFQASSFRHYASRFTGYVLRIIAILSALLLLATLIITQSRGAYLGAAVSLSAWFSLRWPKAAKVAIPPLVVLALATMSFVGWDVVADELTAGDATSGLDGRVEIWSRALYAIQDFSFTGLGLGTFERVVAVLYPLFLNPAGTVPHAHNLLLQVAVDLGLPGLVAYMALLGLTFVSAFSAYRTFRRTGQTGLAGLCAGCIAGLSGMCAHSTVDVANWGIKLAFIPWLVIGLVTALHGLARESEGKSSKILLNGQ
jgi:putative inorganic carbon (HCO3(-)) transporter